MSASLAAAGLFPLPAIPCPRPPASRSRRLQQRYHRTARLTPLANDCISALNKLFISLSTNSSNSSSPSFGPTSSQRRLQSHIVAQAAHYLACRPSAVNLNSAEDERGGDHPAAAILWQLARAMRESDDSTVLAPLGYLPSPTTARPLVASKVSLPAEAGTADLMALLPPELRSAYADAPALLRPPGAAPVRQTRPRVFGTQLEYLSLLRRMRASGMVGFIAQPKVVNGVFCVPKGTDELRLIIDARPANAAFVDPPRVALPTPDVLARLRVPEGLSFFTAKADLDNYYHRLRLPPALVPYFALPPVLAADIGLVSDRADGLLYPCCLTLPMGWSHSVYLAQAAHEHLLNTSTPLQPADRIFPHSADFQLSRSRHLVYIDDVCMFGPDPVQLASWQQSYLEAAARAGVPAKTVKVVSPRSGPVEVLGLEMDGNRGTLGLSPARLELLARDTLAVLAAGSSDGVSMRALVGRWLWAALPRRPALSVLSSVFRFCDVIGRRTFSLWPSVRAELSLLVRLRPLLAASLRDSWFEHALATDASDTGQGVVSTSIPVDQLRRLSSLSGVSPAQMDDAARALNAKLVAGPRWGTLVSSRWSRSEHVNVLEARALSTAVRWAISRTTPSTCVGRNVLVFVDSAVVLSAATKGRSSSPLLLRRLRQLAALLLAAGTRLNLVWVPSAANPADGPSRI
jgi:hypothetical protein